MQMNNMKEKQEAKALLRILKCLDTEKTEIRKTKIVKFAFDFAALAIVFCAYIAVINGYLPGKWGVFVGMFGGVLGGISVYLGISIKEWNVLHPHINKESIKNRLHEIN
jgi:hypothetical protein